MGRRPPEMPEVRKRRHGSADDDDDDDDDDHDDETQSHPALRQLVVDEIRRGLQEENERIDEVVLGFVNQCHGCE